MEILVNTRSHRLIKFSRFCRGFMSQPDSLKGKVALVTGAAQGLGKASSEILLKNGAKVCLGYHKNTGGIDTLPQLEAKYGKDKVMFKKCDVTKMTQMKQTFATVKQNLGSLDIVINNAGVAGEMGNSWETTVDINLKGTIRGTFLAIEHMRKDKGGRGGVIINVSSMAGINPSPIGPAYASTKSAVIMLSQCWSKSAEVLQNGIRINVLAPAVIDTPLLRRLSDPSFSYLPDMASGIIERIGVMSPEEVAETLMGLILDTDKNGAILKVAKNTGVGYQTM